ncbi:YlbF family regulator [Vallitalea okinawensis]|uniref:YlbF family regulator n=1 Tax=Vallitalea okinawensis TaxID=2078660 RepID=UPI001300A791|nr:YlbF family regulator [Vallitalea okinawensis]
MSFEKKAHELAEMVRQTREYKEVQRAKTLINRKPRLANQLKTYQNDQRKLSRQRLSKEDMDKKMKVLQEDFDKLNKYNETRQYMQSMGRLNEKIYNIVEKIYESLEEDLTL